MKMIKIIIIYILIIVISFFTAKYFWLGHNDTNIECDGEVCSPLEGSEDAKDK